MLCQEKTRSEIWLSSLGSGCFIKTEFPVKYESYLPWQMIELEALRWASRISSIDLLLRLNKEATNIAELRHKTK